MPTNLTRFQDAYATLTVAEYRPLILRWLSGWTLQQLVRTATRRAPAAAAPAAFSTAATLHAQRAAARKPVALPAPPQVAAYKPAAVDGAGHVVAAEAVVAAPVPGKPLATKVADLYYPGGVLKHAPGTGEGGVLQAAPLAMQAPVALAGAVAPPAFKGDVEDKLVLDVLALARTWATTATPATPLLDTMRAAFAGAAELSLLELLPARFEELLSPIGVARYYRQLYFDGAEGIGPIEQAITIAPLETLEVILESSRRRIHEEEQETGVEQTTETATETKDTDELSDKVSTMVQNDASVSVSLSATGGVGVWHATAQVGASWNQTRTDSRETMSRRTRELTKRASERLTRTFKLRTRSVDETTFRDFSRRVIKNESPAPVSYGLRRVLRRARVKVQDLGERLVWQTYVQEPGRRLARASLVHFQDAAPIHLQDAPGVPARPVGSQERGRVQTSQAGRSPDWFIEFHIDLADERELAGVEIHSMRDPQGEAVGETPPAVRQDGIEFWRDTAAPGANRYRVHVRTTGNFSVATARSRPARGATCTSTRAREQQRQAAIAAAGREGLEREFEHQRALIVQRSQVPPRPSADLRREEHYELMAAVVEQLTGRLPGFAITPLELEHFHRFFDVDAVFCHAHPSWWKPRYAPSLGSAGERAPYEITHDSEPAPMGSSIGWLIQLDGDRRRNELINSPWARACIPIRAGVEREALAWLARHVEGDIGFDPAVEPLAGILTAIEAQRGREAAVRGTGPEFVVASSGVSVPETTPETPMTPENTYPIIAEVDVTVPTEGFVYETLTVNEP